MKIKTHELADHALNWAVAIALGWVDVLITAYEDPDSPDEPFFRPAKIVNGVEVCGSGERWLPSRNLLQGGALMSSEGIATRRHSNGTWYAMLSSDLGDHEGARWSLFTFKDVPRTASTSRRCRFDGPTQLIAAMRCLVARYLGDEVDVPEALLPLTQA